MAPPTKLRDRARSRRAAAEQSILDATEALCSTRPFLEVTVQDVMAATGLSRTTFYRYFPDLDQVLLRLLVGIAADLRSASALWLASDDDPREQLRRSARRMVATFCEHGPLIQAFTDAAGAGSEIHTSWLAVVDGFVQPTVARVEELVATGRADVVEAAETVRALVLLTERYLVTTFGSGDGVPAGVAEDVLVQAWERTLALRS
ncbi:MAG TPA: TetR/AcrR family transcriptional regulator [Acidimicrobiales bacterium]